MRANRPLFFRILGIAEGMRHARSEKALLVVAVATHGGRDVVREWLTAAGFVEGADFVCAA